MAEPVSLYSGEPALEVGSPEWWLVRLLRQLEGRVPTLQLWDDYYCGRQPLAFASEKFTEAFGSRFPAFTSNFCSLVCEGVAERLEVTGFRGFGSQADEVWGIWQDNQLDAASAQAHLEAMIKGTSYALVEPPASSGGSPTITIEDALDSIVECDPRSQLRRRAGLKRWLEDDGHLIAVVYLPDGVYKYRTSNTYRANDWPGWWDETWRDATRGPGSLEWQGWRMFNTAGFEPWQAPGDADWPLPNPMGVVPLVELPNRPRPGRYGGQSEIQPIRSNQDAINKYRADALIASEFVAFPQRYLLNFEPEVDEATGKAREPFRAAVDRLWTIPPADPDNPDAPQPQIGQLAAADLTPYQTMIGLEVGHVSAISRLPYHYLLGTPQTVPPSGESLKASEAGLEHKTGRAQVFLGNGWEEVARVSLAAQGDLAALKLSGEALWRDTETRNEAVRTDAVVKLKSQGIIDEEQAWQLLGFTPQQIADLRARNAAQPEAPVPPAGAPTAPAAPSGPRMGIGTPGA